MFWEQVSGLFSSTEITLVFFFTFFKNWHFDEDGKDIFTYKNIPFGFSFRLGFWNDFVTKVPDPFDIIIDDGSHCSLHQQKSLSFLFPPIQF